MEGVRAAIVIPARYASSRFPGKALATLAGKPLLQHTWQQASQASVEAVLIATDHEEIYRCARAFGAQVVMTSPEHPSGTDRVAEALKHLPWCQAVLNLQADEPFIRPQMIEQALELLEEAPMATLASPIRQWQELQDPHVVKVVLDAQGWALYFSRAPIPYHRQRGARPKALKHIGLYAYRREALEAFVQHPPTELEALEALEQLRALQMGLRIKVGITHYETLGVDTPEDLRRAEQWLSTSS
jgi:3-deoxy-manno-octulosonate cytidylyltransferase (CMP-KDO synthetase)